MSLGEYLRSPLVCIGSYELQQQLINFGIMQVADKPIWERGIKIKPGVKLRSPQSDLLVTLADNDRRIVSNRWLSLELLGHPYGMDGTDYALNMRFVRLSDKLDEEIFTAPSLGRGLGVIRFPVRAGLLPLIEFLIEKFECPITAKEIAGATCDSEDDDAVEKVIADVFDLNHFCLSDSLVSIERLGTRIHGWYVFVERRKWPYDYFRH